MNENKFSRLCRLVCLLKDPAREHNRQVPEGGFSKMKREAQRARREAAKGGGEPVCHQGDGGAKRGPAREANDGLA